MLIEIVLTEDPLYFKKIKEILINALAGQLLKYDL